MIPPRFDPSDCGPSRCVSALATSSWILPLFWNKIMKTHQNSKIFSGTGLKTTAESRSLFTENYCYTPYIVFFVNFQNSLSPYKNLHFEFCSIKPKTSLQKASFTMPSRKIFIIIIRLDLEVKIKISRKIVLWFWRVNWRIWFSKLAGARLPSLLINFQPGSFS